MLLPALLLTVPSPGDLRYRHFCPGVPPANGVSTTYDTDCITQYPCRLARTRPPQIWATCSPCYRNLLPGGTPRGPCGTGHYCPKSSWLQNQTACAAGTYQPATGGASQADCLPCTVGKYCPEGSSYQIVCPAGSYTPFNRTTGAGPSQVIDSTLCLLCPAGYYCPAGSVKPLYCLPGTYSDYGSSSCTTCEVGRYCPQNATTADQKERLFLCPAGLYCTAGLNRIPSAQFDVRWPLPAGDSNRYSVCLARTTHKLVSPSPTVSPRLAVLLWSGVRSDASDWVFLSGWFLGFH